MKHLAILFLASGLWWYCITVQAQSTVTASGGNASGAGGNASYTIGQIVYTTDNGTTGSVAKGVQQPFEISVITAIDAAKDISLEIVVYPNPATDIIKMKIENFDVQNLRYMIYDINGSLLLNNKVEGNETSIVMSSLLPGIYFLKVSENAKVIKTFKIIKH
jgi:Secretion system C-terminal sorting domain